MSVVREVSCDEGPIVKGSSMYHVTETNPLKDVLALVKGQDRVNVDSFTNISLFQGGPVLVPKDCQCLHSTDPGSSP